MVSKLTKNPLEPKKIEFAPPKPKVVVKPPPRPVVKDEMSAGRGMKLRARAEQTLGALPFSSKAGQGQALGSFRVDAMGGLKMKAAVDALAESRAPSNIANLTPEQEAEQAAQARLDQVTSPDNFAYQLEQEEDPAVRNEMIRLATTNEDYAFVFGPPSGVSELNEGFDTQTVIANAMDEAFRAGEVTQANINDLVENMGEDQAEFFVTGMMMNGENRAVGGVVEAIGIAAEEEGFDRVSALAFTSSEALIDKHLPTASAQREAFEQVEDFVEDFDDRIDGHDGEPAGPRTALEFALASAARLTARGTGYDPPSRLDDELAEVGPRIAQETIARLGENADLDGGVPGALDTLGDATARLGRRDNGDADDYRVASSIAYTQSPELIADNLKTDADKRAALENLNGFLADRRDSFGDAAEGDFSLLRDPQALDGINNLLTGSPQLIGQLLNSGAEGEATLVQLMESITLNPNVPEAERNRFNGAINGFLETEIQRATSNPNVVGNEIGTLLGLIQVAGNRAVEGAEGDDKSKTEEVLAGFVEGVASGVIGLALAGTGPIGSVVGGAIVNQVLAQIFGESPGPTQAQIRNAFVEKLEAAGINVSSGEAGLDALGGALRETIDALEHAAESAVDPERAAILDQARLLLELNTAINDGFGNTIDSEDGAAGELARELDEREDEV